MELERVIHDFQPIYNSKSRKPFLEGGFGCVRGNAPGDERGEDIIRTEK